MQNMDQQIVLDVQSGSVVLIHKGWTRSKRRFVVGQNKSLPQPQLIRNTSRHHTRVDASMLLEDEVTPQEDEVTPEKSPVPDRKFEFVNGTKPFRNRDPAVRKLVRAHVMRDLSMSKKRQQQLRDQKALLHVLDPRKGDQLWTNVPKYDLSPAIPRRLSHEVILGSFPVDMQPNLHKLLLRYLTTVPGPTHLFDSPAKYNPLRAEWFRYAMTDKALFHAMLYTACVCIGLIEGVAEPADAIVQMDKTLQLVNRRLLDPSGDVTDGIIAALTCVALGEVRLHLTCYTPSCNLPKLTSVRHCVGILKTGTST